MRVVLLAVVAAVAAVLLVAEIRRERNRQRHAKIRMLLAPMTAAFEESARLVGQHLVPAFTDLARAANEFARAAEPVLAAGTHIVTVLNAEVLRYPSIESYAFEWVPPTEDPAFDWDATMEWVPVPLDEVGWDAPPIQVDESAPALTLAELFAPDARHCTRCGIGIDDLHPHETLCVRCWEWDL